MRRSMAAVSTWCVITYALSHACVLATATTPYERWPGLPWQHHSPGFEAPGLGSRDGAWAYFSYGKCFQQTASS